MFGVVCFGTSVVHPLSNEETGGLGIRFSPSRPARVVHFCFSRALAAGFVHAVFANLAMMVSSHVRDLVYSRGQKSWEQLCSGKTCCGVVATESEGFALRIEFALPLREIATSTTTCEEWAKSWLHEIQRRGEQCQWRLLLRRLECTSQNGRS